MKNDCTSTNIQKGSKPYQVDFYRVINIIRDTFLHDIGIKAYLTDLRTERASAARYKNLDSSFEMKRSLSSISSKTTTETVFGLFAIDFSTGLK